MRIVQLTPGTGNFHCGNCLRDNALVNALRRMDHDVLMVPLYLPHVTDETDAVDGTPIFFGGVNVYLEQKLALFRHTPRWIDRLFNTPGLLRFAADRAGMTRASDLGEMTVSMLAGEEGNQNKELTKLIEFLNQHGHPDVVSLSNALLIGMARRIRKELNAPVVCTLSGEDAFLDSLIEPHREQCWHLLAERAAEVDAFVAVSRYYGDEMGRRLRLDPKRVHTVYNGINIEGYAPADAPPDPPVIGYLARMHPGKGLATLVDAFIEFKRRDTIAGLKLHIVGAATPADQPFVDSMRDRLRKAGCENDATFEANVDHDRKIEFLRSISVLSVPATYGESFGLYLLEAWAAGVPVVQPRTAAFVELLDDTGAGKLCDPDSPTALAEALEAVLSDRAEAQRMGRAGRDAVMERFTVDRMAAGVMNVFEQAGRQFVAPASE